MDLSSEYARQLADILSLPDGVPAEDLYSFVEDLQRSLNLTDDPEEHNEVYVEGNSIVIDPVNGGKVRITFEAMK